MSRFELKIIAAMLFVAVIPLVASVFLVGQVISVSDSVADGQMRRLRQPLSHAGDAYRELFALKKRSFQLQGRLIARDQLLVAAAEEQRWGAAQTRVEQLISEHPAATRIALLDEQGTERAVAEQRAGVEAPRDLAVTVPIASGRVRSVFVTSEHWFTRFRQLGKAQRATVDIASIRSELALFYRVAFITMFGAALLVAFGFGLWIARRTTKRVSVLAGATRRVAAGDLDTQVALETADELGELARDFNEMVSQIRESRGRIAYLEKIGAWQEIARRLAHEIKNPLTPIQLAMQQVHKNYRGEDTDFRQTLDEARDIIREEVDGLRRLVQDFSAFAKLPTVQPESVDLNSLVEDFLRSHADLAQKAGVDWKPLEPPARVMVDRMLIKHVLYNLVANAVQAAETTPGDRAALRVTLRTEQGRVPGYLALRVTDNGPGMGPETSRRAFDPYYTTKETGTGLGLAIVKKIVLEHQGHIALETRPGGGSSFLINLPQPPADLTA